MTKQACTEFFAKVNTDAALQQDFLKAIEGKEDESMLMDAAHSVAEVGTKYGYDFTAEEVAQRYKENKEAAAMEGEGGELSEEALEMVAGGNYYDAYYYDYRASASGYTSTYTRAYTSTDTSTYVLKGTSYTSIYTNNSVSSASSSSRTYGNGW
ncbi:Nif11-like leader peptide family natural product precursor [Microcoleus sp. T2B6]|uniref:Nif11-like leader peptide family natural product precursor n=1 Tax=Microcoleus sp. T2B6 TaxID=3055424 RepID=UPI002FD4137A